MKKLCNGKKPTQKRLPDWKKEVLLTFDNLEELKVYEEIVVGDRWKTDPLCLNYIPGGDWGGGDASQMNTPEARDKHTSSMKKWAQTEEGKKHLSEMGKKGSKTPRTMTDKWRQAQANKAKGRKWINDGVNKKLVQLDDLDEYLANGWILGRPQCDKNKISQNTKEAMKNIDLKGRR